MTVERIKSWPYPSEFKSIEDTHEYARRLYVALQQDATERVQEMGTLGLSGLTANSVLFAGTGSIIAQNNSALSWTNSTTALNVDGSAVFNESGADMDFRIEGDSKANLFFVDASTDRIGVNQNTPTHLVHILGTGLDDAAGSLLITGGTQQFIQVDSASRARFICDAHDADASIEFQEDDSIKWVVGFDYTDSLAFTISEGIPGTNNRFKIASGGAVTIGGTLGVTGAVTGASFNALTLTAQATGFTIAGGTSSRTLTVEDTSLVNQDLTTDAGPVQFHQLNLIGSGAYCQVDSSTTARFIADAHDADGFLDIQEDNVTKWVIGMDFSDSLAFTISEGLPGTNNRFKIASGGVVTIPGTLILSTVAAAGTDTDKFLVLDGSDNVDYRTGANVLSDIGGAAASHAMSTHSDEDTYNISTSGTLGAGNATLGTIGCGSITVADGSSISLQEDITFTGATTENLIKFPDNLLDAWSWKEGSNKYFSVVTLDDEEDMIFYKSVDILHTSTHADDHALEIDTDAANLGDVKALDIDYITGSISGGQDEGIILINIDETAANAGSDVFGLEVLATDGDAGIYGMKVGPVIGPIHQDSGTFANPTFASNDTPATDVPVMRDGLITPAEKTTAIFTSNSDYIIIGAAAAFQDLELIFTTPSTRSIKPTFWYSIDGGSDNFTQFTPVDGTDGCKHTGVISWDASDLTNHVADATTTTFNIKIIRTKNNPGTTPVLGYAKTSSTTEYVWDKSGDVNIRNLSASGTLGITGTVTIPTALTGVIRADSGVLSVDATIANSGANSDITSMSGITGTILTPTNLASKTTAAWNKFIGSGGDYADWATMIAAMPDLIAHAVTVTIKAGTTLTEYCDIWNKQAITVSGAITIQGEKYFPASGAIPTADSATATTLRDAALATAALGNDYFNGCWIKINDGTGTDNGYVLITDYVDATGDVVVASWPGTQPDNTSRYLIVGALIDAASSRTHGMRIYRNMCEITISGIGLKDATVNNIEVLNCPLVNFKKVGLCGAERAGIRADSSFVDIRECGIVGNNTDNHASYGGVRISIGQGYVYRCGISDNSQRGVLVYENSFVNTQDCFGDANGTWGVYSKWSGQAKLTGTECSGSSGNHSDEGTADTAADDQAASYA